jgi:hypothetical protein
VVEPQTVNTGERVGDLAGHPGGLQARQRTMVEDHFQRLPGGILADDVGADRRISAVHGIEHPKEPGVGRD